MANQIKAEIRQNKPFASIGEEVFLNVVRTSDRMRREVAMLLDSCGLTPSQYNVLRILRGAGASGLNSCDIAERMVSVDPDVARLLDRMEKLNYVQRRRDREDRRYVTTHITSSALAVLKKLDRPMADLHRYQLARLSPAEIETLIHALEKIRGREMPAAQIARSA